MSKVGYQPSQLGNFRIALGRPAWLKQWWSYGSSEVLLWSNFWQTVPRIGDSHPE